MIQIVIVCQQNNSNVETYVQLRNRVQELVSETVLYKSADI